MYSMLIKFTIVHQSIDFYLPSQISDYSFINIRCHSKYGSLTSLLEHWCKQRKEQSDLSISCRSSSFDELDTDNNDSRVNLYQFEPIAADAQLYDENVHEIVDDNDLNMALLENNSWWEIVDSKCIFLTFLALYISINKNKNHPTRHYQNSAGSPSPTLQSEHVYLLSRFVSVFLHLIRFWHILLDTLSPCEHCFSLHYSV